jgi:hypothetical protein
MIVGGLGSVALSGGRGIDREKQRQTDRKREREKREG